MLPIQGEAYVTQGYGLTSFAKSPIGKRAYKNFPGGIHPGLDFGTHGKHLPIVALVDGEIVRADNDVHATSGWGGHIELLGTDGWRRQYAHLSALSVKVGQMVKRGDVLGTVGNSGSSTGVHLHYGNRRRKTFGGWEYRDPSVDFTDKIVETVIPEPPRLIAGKLYKGTGAGIYLYTGTKKHGIPDWTTKVLLFGDAKNDFDTIPDDYLAKVPEGVALPSLI